ncbi:hypothetical protein [Paenibacillus agricola]|uniref:Uncharacterized protein n=1 Tax=Paenibacillus agricola TaxID=2716264 RepID=A0ABX0JC40_9BACL|nr:hypothetical protein [Paenibacillus agricola]NHN33518.1 hypothetical protein [Paenibacillus agricola]
MAKRKTKDQITQEQAALVKKRFEDKQRQNARAEEADRSRKRKLEQSKHRERLRVQRSRPRMELPSQYAGEMIYVHKKIYDGFMKKKGITITSCKAVGGSGGKLVIEYDVFRGGHGTLELQDLGPMPV